MSLFRSFFDHELNRFHYFVFFAGMLAATILIFVVYYGIYSKSRFSLPPHTRLLLKLQIELIETEVSDPFEEALLCIDMDTLQRVLKNEEPNLKNINSYVPSQYEIQALTNFKLADRGYEEYLAFLKMKYPQYDFDSKFQ